MGALVDFPQSDLRLVICEQKKQPTLQVVLKVLNSPESTLHFKQAGCVVFLKIGEFPTGIPYGKVVAVLVDLREDGP